MSDQPNYAICTILYIVAHFVGVAALVLVGLWIDYDKQGFVRNFQTNTLLPLDLAFTNEPTSSSNSIPF
jgi:hypothetical protein